MNALIISAALDTNGQNARYAKASEKWGTADGVLKALALGKYDPASVIGRYQAAADKSDVLRIRSAHKSTHIYQQMPADILWNRSTEPMVKQLALDADIIHLNNSWRPWQMLRLRIRKPMLLHHHGSLFRSDPKGMLMHAERQGWTQCVSTVDLTQMAPERLHWAPTAYDVDWLEAFGKEHRREPDGRILVVSAPTNREYKSTDALIAAVAALQSEGLPVDLDLIEGKPWLEGMRLKARADIYFDQVGLGYGCNAVEAWGMGIPVIAGASDWTLNRMEAMWGALPFYTATEGSIGGAIAALATKTARAKWRKAGMAHVRKYHDELPALTRLAELYRMTIDQVPYQVDTPIPPARFTASVQQVHIAGKFINFPCEIDNPFLATKIRVHAMRYRKFGIEEVA